MSANPHEAVVTPEAKPAVTTTLAPNAWEQTDIAKKFGNDPKKAQDGFFALQNHASAQEKRAAALEKELADMKAGLSQLGNGGATKPTSVTHALAQDLAVEPATLMGAVAETLVALLAPGAEAQKAVAAYAAENEDFAARKSKVEAFRDKNPEVAARYTKMESADPRGAIEWLDMQYLKQPDTPAEEAAEISTQRTHAGNPGGSGPAVRSARGVDEVGTVNELAEKFAKGEVNKETYRSAALDLTSGKQEFQRQLAQMTGQPQG